MSRALMVLLNELSPRQRVAYVLHDLFAVPFDQIAAALEVTVASAKKLASRARVKLHGAEPTGADAAPEQRHIVEAFLAAACGGDIPAMIHLMAPDAIRLADRLLLPVGGRTEVRGAASIAEETKTFIDRITAATPVLVTGRPGALIAPGGRPLAVIGFSTRGRAHHPNRDQPLCPGLVTLA